MSMFLQLFGIDVVKKKAPDLVGLYRFQNTTICYDLK